MLLSTHGQTLQDIEGELLLEASNRISCVQQGEAWRTLKEITHWVSVHHPKSLERRALAVSPGKRAAMVLHLERKGKLARMRLQLKLIPPAAAIPTIIHVRKLDGYEALFGKDTAPCLSLTHNRPSKPQLTD